jgi:CopG family transcriptional regulator/antitoxin EndoAI
MAKVLVSIPEQLLTKIDEIAESECRTRSELLRESFRLYIKVNLLQKQMEKSDAQETGKND